jgi:hypothetical protein
MSIPVHNNFNMNSNEIQDVSIEKLSAHPTGGGLYNGRIWELTTDNKVYYYNGTAIVPLASESFVTSAINQLGQIQGGFSAVAGLLPTAANKTQGDLTTIKKGDFWIVTAAGTIAGIAGADELSIGDVIQFYGSTPSTAADWLGIQRNINDSAVVGNVTAEKQTVNLVANTPLNVNAATIANIHSIQVYNSAGDLILLDIQKLGGNNQRTLTSKKALTGVVVEMTGT